MNDQENEEDNAERAEITKYRDLIQHGTSEQRQMRNFLLPKGNRCY